MWYTLTIFIVVFQLVISMALPIFPVNIIPNETEEEGFNSPNIWERAFNTDYIFGVALIPIPDDQLENNYPGMPQMAAPTDLDELEAGANPLETFIGLMAFHVQGAEWLSLIFWLCDFILLLLFIKLLRGS